MIGKRTRLIPHRGLALAGALLGLALLAWAAHNLDWGAVRRELAAARVLPWMPLGVLVYLAGHVVRGARTRLLVSPDARLTLATATHVVVLGYAVNNLLPARLGEFARAGMLAERTGLPVAQALTVTLVERILDGWTLFLLLFLASRGVSAHGWVQEVARVAGIVFAAATAGILLVLLMPGLFLSAVARTTGRLPAAWHDRMIRMAVAVTRGLFVLRRPRDAAGALLLSAGVWLLEAGLFFLMLPALGLPLRPAWALLAVSVTNLGILVPSSPGYIGPFHFFCMQTLLLLGAPAAAAFGYAVAVHLSFFVPITLWGVAIIAWYGLELGSTIALARAARRLPFPVPE